MKKTHRCFPILLILLILLVGCGNFDNKNTEADRQQTQTQQMDTEKETTHTHAYTEVITTETTCEADGVKTFTCECGDSYTEVIKAIGHDYEDVITAPTCGEKGYTTHTCRTCGNAYTDTEVSATGHAYGKYTYNKDATYDKDGTETATCSACGNKNTRTKTGTKLVKEEPECPYELGVWYDMGWYFFKLYPDGASVESGSGQEYGQILNQRYPDVVNTPAGTAVNMYGESKWNGWYVYWWVAVPQGKYVFYNY